MIAMETSLDVRAAGDDVDDDEDDEEMSRSSDPTLNDEAVVTTLAGDVTSMQRGPAAGKQAGCVAVDVDVNVVTGFDEAEIGPVMDDWNVTAELVR